MRSNLLTKWAENKYDRFLFLLFCLVVAIALPERRFMATSIILILFLVAMLSTIRQIRPGRWWLKYYSDPIRIVKGFRRKFFSQSPFIIQSFTSHLGLLYAAFVFLTMALLGLQLLRLVDISTWSHGYSVMALLLFIVILVPILVFQREFFSTQKVTANTLKGGIAIYVLMGVGWAIVYTILLDFDPASFDGVNPSQIRADLLHFSFVTLTTLGYGNILPAGPPTRIASDLEAIAGVLYPAILISRLVNNYTAKSEESL